VVREVGRGRPAHRARHARDFSFATARRGLGRSFSPLVKVAESSRAAAGFFHPATSPTLAQQYLEGLVPLPLTSRAHEQSHHRIGTDALGSSQRPTGSTSASDPLRGRTAARWGATEAHNWHLPYGTDSHAKRRSWPPRQAASPGNSGARVAILPNDSLRSADRAARHPLLHQHESQHADCMVLDDVIASLEGVGVPKFVDHERPRRQRLPPDAPRATGAASPRSSSQRRDPGIRHTRARTSSTIVGDHADERETSPHAAPASRTSCCPRRTGEHGADNPWRLTAMREKWAWAQRAWTKATNDTGSGNPAASTAEKGARYMKVLTEKIASYFLQLAAVNPAELYER
jgi:creatinine amidohydrolase